MTSGHGNLSSDLLALAKAGDPKAVTAIISSYLPTAGLLAERLLYAEKEDMVQEGLISLLAAIETFDDSAGATFSTYASRCMKNAMLTAQKKSFAKKRTGTKLSLSDLDETLTSGDDLDPQQIVVQKETLDGLIKLVDGILSKFERTVLALYLQGHSYSSISSRLDKPEKSVDNALQRVRNKLKHAQDELLNNSGE